MYVRSPRLIVARGDPGLAFGTISNPPGLGVWFKEPSQRNRQAHNTGTNVHPILPSYRH